MRIVIFFVLILVGCSGEKKTDQLPVEWNQDKSTAMNKNLAIEEEIQIKLFLEEHKDWVMEKTGTGLQYYIYEKGNGDLAKIGQTAEVEMKISLLDGKECYKTEKDGIDEFVIDKSQVESGIHEGIKKMSKGDKAKLILPSHLAHGLIGDFDKFPPLSVLVVDIHLVNLK